MHEENVAHATWQSMTKMRQSMINANTDRHQLLNGSTHSDPPYGTVPVAAGIYGGALCQLL